MLRSPYSDPRRPTTEMMMLFYSVAVRRRIFQNQFSGQILGAALFLPADVLVHQHQAKTLTILAIKIN